MANSVKEFDKLAKSKKKIPKNLRLYYELDNKHHYLINGKIRDGFSFDIKEGRIDRDFLLSIYGKMEFIFNELIRITIVGFSHDDKSKKLLYILSIVPTNRKIRLFLDWGVFGKEFTQSMSRLFEVRNDIIHSAYVDEITYRKSRVLHLSKKEDLKEFLSDLEQSWNDLVKIYSRQLQKTDWSEIIKELRKSK